MSIYENNMSILKDRYPEIYQGILLYQQDTDTVLIGDAVSGETFLALVENDNVYPLNSMYDPSHASERFAVQLQQLAPSTILLIVGFNDGRIIRAVVSDDCPVKLCIVCEPSIDVFFKAIQEFDLRDVISSDRMHLIIKGINDTHAEYTIRSSVNYMDWKAFSMIALPYYATLFEEEVQLYYKWYMETLDLKKAERESLEYFAEVRCKNEIYALKWLLKSKSINDVKEKIPQDIPCIVVSAGPSLEKNVSYLRDAKGKACIIAVDSVCEFLFQHGVVPDYTCTIDARESFDNYKGDHWKGIPMFLSTSSSSDLLEYLQDFEPIYIRLGYDYYNELLGKKGKKVTNFDGGGSVGTVIFRLAIELGFRTVIIVGQDLAYTGGLSHAGTGRVTERVFTAYGVYKVPGYYGEDVYTSGDYKRYIDWYRQMIPLFSGDHTIINATEGGAVLEGAIQMPLKKAVDKYCIREYNFRQLIEELPCIFNEPEDSRKYCLEIQQDLNEMIQIKTQIQNTIPVIERIIQMVGERDHTAEEVKELEVEINDCIDRLQQLRTYDLLYNRSIRQNIDMHDQLDEQADSDPDREQKHLYQMLNEHLKGILSALNEVIPLWEKVLKDIKEGDKSNVNI